MSESKPSLRDVERLLAEASVAPNAAEERRLVMAAEIARSAIADSIAADRELDLGTQLVAQVQTPVRVHENHTTATDWMGDLYTTAAADSDTVEREMVAQASVWYSRISPEVKADREEFEVQATGLAHRIASAYGEISPTAEGAFIDHVTTMRNRDLRTGAVHDAASGLAQVGEGGFPAEQMAGLQVDNALPGEATSSERAPAIRELEANQGANASQDVVPPNDPGLRRELGANPQQAQAARKEASMNTRPCPTCGNGRVAVRVAPPQSFADIAMGRVAHSELDQIDQVADAADNPRATPLPTEVAWPWEMNDGAVQNTINTAEQQIAEREQRKGASLANLSREQLAEVVARRAYEAAKKHVLGGQDDSGWMGDMGAQGVTPGQQDGGNPPSSNLGEPDPVYGYGGDNGNQPLKPYGAGETSDYTNNPGQMWQPGQPAQMDLGGRGMSTAAIEAKVNEDPDLQRALEYARRRRVALRTQLAGQA